jgi:signal transduction histidine kinase
VSQPDPNRGAAEPSPPRAGPWRRFGTRHARAIDVALALLYAAVNGFGTLAVAVHDPLESAVGESAVTPDPSLWRFLVWFAIVALGAVGLIVWRRSRPVWFFALAVVLNAASWCLDLTWSGLTAVTNLSGDLFLMWLAMFALATRTRALVAWAGFAVWLVEDYGFYLLAGSGHALAQPLPLALFNLVLTLIFLQIGGRRRYVGALVARADYLARDRDQQARLAVAAERARIARELHDIIAHSLTIMVRLSDGAARLVETDPARARAALTEASDTGRSAVADMRRLLGVLRADDDVPRLGEPGSAAAGGQPTPLAPGSVEWGPQPGVADLPALVTTFRAAGLPVTFDGTADIPPDPAFQLALYRMAQESLTNALRHAHSPTAVRLRIASVGAVIVLEVSDDGRADRTGPPTVGAGHGLISVRQRAAIYGGEVEAGPTGEGWRVRVTMHPPTSD